MHQYLDSDGSGTSPTCVSSTIGAERLQNATAWLQQNNLKGFLGEIGAGSNAACITAIQGALWWAAGPWWGDVSVSYYLCHCYLLDNILDNGRRMLTLFSCTCSTTKASSLRMGLLSRRSSLRRWSPSSELYISRKGCALTCDGAEIGVGFHI